MLYDATITKSVVIRINSLDEKSKVVPSSVIATYLLKQLRNSKACEHGYFLSVIKLHKIGDADTANPEFVVFPVDFTCRIYTPVTGEVLTGVVHKVFELGVLLRSGPMNVVFLSARMMGNYNYVSGETPTFVGEDSSKIGMGVVVCYEIFGVNWVQDKAREFRVLASLRGDGLGPVASNGFDGMDFE